LGSRGITNRYGWSTVVGIDIRFPSWSRIESEIDVERFVLDGGRNWSVDANGWMINYRE
jgi:hypothetical protein